MKMTFKKLITLFSVISLIAFSFASCNSNDDKKPEAEDTTLIDAKEALTIQTVVAADETSITLPSKVTGFDDVSVTWASANTAVITSDGTVTAEEGTASTSVTLTATLTYGTQKETKTFTVSVYQKSHELTDAEILDAAIAKFNFDYDSTKAYNVIDVPETIAVSSKTVTVAYDSSNTNAVKYDSDKVYVYGGFTAASATLTATFSYNGSTKTVIENLTIPAITEFKFIDDTDADTKVTSSVKFNSSSKGIYNEVKEAKTEDGKDSIDKTEFNYVLNAASSQITITATKIYNEDEEKMMTIDQMVSYYSKSVKQAYKNMINAIKTLESEPTYENLYEATLAFNSDKYDRSTYTYEVWLSEQTRKDENGKKIAYSADDSAEIQASEANKAVAFIKLIFGIDDVNVTYDSFLESFYALVELQIEYSLYSEIPDNTIYGYEVIYSTDYDTYPTGVWFKELRAVYDSAKPWYKQVGKWYDETNKYSMGLTEFEWGDDEYELSNGEWNVDFTEFTVEAEDEDETDITFNVTDNGNGTLTVTDGTVTKTLTFTGSDLSDDDDD
jgi:hypothetical protein